MPCLRQNSGTLIASCGRLPCLSNIGYLKLLQTVITTVIHTRQRDWCYTPPCRLSTAQLWSHTSIGLPHSLGMQPFSPIPRNRGAKPITKVLNPHLRELPLHFPHQRCLWVHQAGTQTSTWGSSSSSGSSAPNPCVSNT